MSAVRAAPERAPADGADPGRDVPLAVETSEVSLRYGREPALDGVSLQVPRGVLGAIVGPNGAGKSTLLKVLLGLDDGHSGEAKLLGRAALEARHRVGYVPQRSSVDWDFPANALDVVTMGLFRQLGPFRRAGRAARERAMAALDEVGLADLARRQIGQLSGGQQQRVFLARALVQDAELYLLDEPFAGVDAASEAALMAVLRRLNEAGSTVLAVHHDLNTLTSYFDWLALLNVRLHAQGPLAEVYAPGPLQAAYGGRLPFFDTGAGRHRPDAAGDGRTGVETKRAAQVA